jgi:hypothetical protein
MNAKIDLKSALCGVAIGVLAFLAIGAANSPTNPIGRYQASGGAGFFLIIDTTTGKVWGSNLSGANYNKTDAGFWDAKVEK